MRDLVCSRYDLSPYSPCHYIASRASSSLVEPPVLHVTLVFSVASLERHLSTHVFHHSGLRLWNARNRRTSRAMRYRIRIAASVDATDITHVKLVTVDT